MATTATPTKDAAKTERRWRSGTESETQRWPGTMPTAGNTATNAPLLASEAPTRWVVDI